MFGYWRLIVVSVCLLVGAPAWAQDNRGDIGAEVQDVTREEAERLGWESPRGVKVVATRPGGPAATAGIVAEDIITSFDSQDVENKERFLARVGDKGAGVQVRLRLLRGGKERNITVTLSQPPAETAKSTVDKSDLPILILDPGGHMGVIKSLTFTPDGKRLLSAGDDKVVRVWDWDQRKTVRMLRGQVGDGDDGMVYAMALSPNGRLLATAGKFHTADITRGSQVRIYDFESGTVLGLLSGHTNIVSGLAFSPDSRLLISGSADRSAIIWDVASRRLLHRLPGHTNSVYGVAFTPDGLRAVSASKDKTMRLWLVRDGTLVSEMRGHADELDRALAIRASDGMIASGDLAGEIRLWDGKTGQFYRTLGRQEFGVGSLAFSPDGLKLISTCSIGGCSNRPQIVWEVATGQRLAQPKLHNNIVLATTLHPTGRLVATAGGTNRQIHVWDIVSGESQRLLVGNGGTVWTAGIAPDGSKLAWGVQDQGMNYQPEHAYSFFMQMPVAKMVLGRPEKLSSQEAARYLRGQVSYGAYLLQHRRGAYGDGSILDVVQGGRVVASIERGPSDGYDHRAYTFTKDGQTIISGGSNGVIMGYTLSGKFLGEYIGHEGDVWAVTPSADGRLLISGSDDQTVRVWNIKTRELIVTLFNGTDGEWVMWTPQGYYAGSPGADKIVGWQINKGFENAAEYVGADQLRTHLHRPDIVEKAIVLASAERAVRETPGTTFKLADLLKRPAPRFRIVAPAGGSTIKGARTTIKVDIEQVPDPIKVIRIHVNGRQVQEVTPETGSGGLKGAQEFDVPLGKGRNEVRVTISNAIGDKTEAITLMQDVEGDLDKRGTLYILAIGVQRYPGLGKTCGPNGDASCDLRFAVADALKLVEAAERRLGPAHNKVIKKVLVNGRSDSESPTAGNILDAIDILKEATETDTVLLFIAGHGVNDGPNYRFLATNAERLGSSYRGQTVVSWQQLQDAIEAAKGRRILFLDTCHSGSAFNQRLGNAAYHANIITYTAARFDQEALEDSILGHGLFTYAVVEGLEGKGQFSASREISTMALHEYVKQRVDQLAKAIKGQQEPQYFMGRDAKDYILAKW